MLPQARTTCSNSNVSVLPLSCPLRSNSNANDESLLSNDSCLFSSPMSGATPVVSNYSGIPNPVPILNTPMIKRIPQKNFIDQDPNPII